MIDLEKKVEDLPSTSTFSQIIPEEKYFDKQPITAPPHLFHHILLTSSNDQMISDSHFIVNNSSQNDSSSFIFLAPSPHVVL